MNPQDEKLSSVWFYHQKQSEKLKGGGEGFLISSKYFRYFVIISPWLNKLESHLPNNALCRVWLKLAQWYWRRRSFLKFRQYILAISLLSPLGKGRGPSIEKKLESPHIRMICGKCG